jgi:hypothetical protein
MSHRRCSTGAAGAGKASPFSRPGVSLPRLGGAFLPADTCAWCEYFDGGGERAVIRARGGEVVEGDCHHRLSDRFTTSSDETCPAFTPESGSGGDAA